MKKLPFVFVLTFAACVSFAKNTIQPLDAEYAPRACNDVVPITSLQRGNIWESAFQVPDTQTIVYLGSNLMLEGEDGLFKRSLYSCFYDMQSHKAEFTTTKIVVLVLEKPHKTLIQTNMTAGKYQIIGVTKKGFLHASHQNDHIVGGGKPGLFGVPSKKTLALNMLLSGIGGVIGDLANRKAKARIAFREDTNKVCAKPGSVWLCKSQKKVPFHFEIIELAKK